MSGLLALYAFSEEWNLAKHVFYGLLALRHRGSLKYVVCPVDRGSVECIEVDRLEDLLSMNRRFRVAIAAALPERNVDRYVVLSKTSERDVAVITSRPLSQPEIVVDVVRKVIRSEDLEDLPAEVPSFLAVLSNGDVIAFREPMGLSPLVVGGYGFDLAIVSTESSAIDVLGADVRAWLEPGEAVYVAKYLVKRLHSTLSTSRSALCAFELLYLARHDAEIDGISVYEFRKRLGMELSRYAKRDLDVVVGVPETAIPYAIGLAQSLGKPFEIGFVHTSRLRAALSFDPLERLIAIHLKMNPVRAALEGKKIALVDDSMVTGSTVKSVVQILRYRVGAEEVHLFIASPPIVKECPYSMLRYERSKLLAANLGVEDSMKYLEVDSLTWIPIEVLNGVAKEYGITLCGYCFGCRLLGGGR